jgi:hypothetical protein
MHWIFIKPPDLGSMPFHRTIPRFPLSAARPSRGFALVITLSLLILLTILAVGLLSLSSIQLRNASQGEAMSAARANARMALMIAIGDIQKSLGPDGRISAPADQSTAPSGPHSRWVGVHDAWNFDNGVTTRPGPSFVQWLGSYTDPAAARQKDFAATVGTSEIPLVSQGTLGKTDPANADKVTAPAIPITGGTRSGRAAWWVADESMKANVISGTERPALAKDAEALFAANSGVAASSAALENLGEIAVTDPRRASYLTQNQLRLKNPKTQTLFHDVTTYSRGLAVDVTRKRWKFDYSIFALQPRSQVEGLALYKADGKLNKFTVANGRLANDGAFRSVGANPLDNFANLSNQPGINMEELWIYSNLYRNLTWSAGTPKLLAMKGAENGSSADFRHRALSDPWFSYSKPVFAAVQFVFSFVSQSDPKAAGKFRMLLQMDALVKIWNPNNIKVEIPAGASYAVQLLSVPFKVQWSITPASGTGISRPQSGLGNNTYALNRGTWSSSSNKYGQNTFNWLRGNIGGLAQSGASTGYTLEPGECKIFGHDKNLSSATWSSDPNVNLSPGWGPGRQALIIADFGANSLDASDSIEFIVTPDKDCQPSGGSRTYCNKWIGHRAAGSQASGGNGGLALGGNSLPVTIDFTNPDPQYFPVIRSSQRLNVSQYSTPKPFMIFGHYLNVEQSSVGTRDAFANTPRLLTNPLISTRRFRNLDADQLTASQEIWRCDSLPLAYDSPLIDISSKDLGRFGGSHSITMGVTRCATRQIDAAPPMSLMSLSHAVANGFADRFSQATERVAKGLDGLQSDGLTGNYKFESGDIAFSTVSYAAPQVERAIGNAFATPFVEPKSVRGQGVYHVSSSSTVPLFDHSYLANAALFDSWFCSSLHDGTKFPGGTPYADSRSATTVLTEFFEKSPADKGSCLLNTRIVPASNLTTAKSRLFSGSALHPEAMSRIAAHVFLDGAFNINSTRKDAWKAVLATARDTARRSSTGSSITNSGTTPLGSSGLAAASAAKPISNPTEVEQWSGYRALDDKQLDRLAEAIVKEVKARGPFLSLSDFLNRRPDATGDMQLLGTVQAAIEAAGLNAPLKGGSRGVAAADFGKLPGAAVAGAGGGMSRSAGIPGYVMQSDVLAPFANELTPRGDTFRVRAYGAATDANGRIVAEAWCEAVVQRLPEYLDPADASETAYSGLASTVNKSFGRRFRLVDFQWLPRNAV